MQMSEPWWNNATYLEAMATSYLVSTEELEGCERLLSSTSPISYSKQGIKMWTTNKTVLVLDS